MQGISTFSWYPRGVLGLQNLGPGVAHGFITAGLPTRLVNGPGATKMTKPVSNPFDFNPNTLKDAVGFKVTEPEKIIHPNLKPTVNFSLPTSTKRLDAISMREDINKDTSDLDGVDLLGKISTYVLDLYRQQSSPFELSASPFQSLVNACKRLNLNMDPVLAGLPRTINQRSTMGEFVKVNIWLMGAAQTFDKNLKPGYIYMAQQMVPVSTLVGDKRPPAWILDLNTRRVSVGVANVSLADIAQGQRLPDVGLAAQGAPNLADGRDGKQNVANQRPDVPAIVEEVKVLENVAEAVNEAAALQDAIAQIQRPESLKKYSFQDQPQPPQVVIEAGPVEEVAKQVVQEEVKQEEIKEPEAPPPTPEEIYEREAETAQEMKRLISTEMLNARGDPFLKVFQLYAQDKDAEARLLLEEILNTKEPDGVHNAYPTVVFLAKQFRDDPNRMIEALGDIRRNGYKDRFVAAGSRMRLDPFEVRNETYKFLKNSAYREWLLSPVGPSTTKELHKAVMELKNSNPWVYHYIDSRNQYTPAEKWRSLQKLMFTKGQKGFGRKRKATRKATRKDTRTAASRWATKRHKPY